MADHTGIEWTDATWNPAWVRSIRDQCKETGTAFFFKQWGEWAPDKEDGSVPLDSVRRIGKKRAGRILDGVEHNAFPRVRP